jgi:hypothetical protein
MPPQIAPDGSYWDIVPTGPGFAALREYNPATGVQKQFSLGDEAAMQLQDEPTTLMTPGPDGNIWYTYFVRNFASDNFVYYVGMLNPTTGAFESFSQATPSQALPSSAGNPPSLALTL